MTRFTPELMAALKSVQRPLNNGKMVTVDFVEFPDYLAARTYENEIMALSDGAQLNVLEYLHKLRNIAESMGFTFYFDGAKGDPPRKKM